MPSRTDEESGDSVALPENPAPVPRFRLQPRTMKLRKYSVAIFGLALKAGSLRGCLYVDRKTRLFRDAVLFVLGAQHPVDGIGSAAAGLVIVADLHFAEEADCQQIKSAEEEAHGGHHQRAMR